MPTKKRSPAAEREVEQEAVTTRETSTSRSRQRITGPTPPRSVVMQARVEAEFARALVEQDAVVLGLDGRSAVVREGLRLVHERAQQAAMIAAYEEFYGGEPAPLPAGVAAADRG